MPESVDKTIIPGGVVGSSGRGVTGGGGVTMPPLLDEDPPLDDELLLDELLLEELLLEELLDDELLLDDEPE